MNRRSKIARLSRIAAARAAWAASLLLGIVIGSFVLFRVVPGDAARVALGQNASEASVERLRSEMGLDKPILVQLADYGRALTHGDLGRSLIDGRNVTGEVSARFLVTGRLALLSAVFSLVLSYLLALLAYKTRSVWPVAVSRIGVLVPSYSLGILAAILAGAFLPWLPLTGGGTGIGGWAALCIPSLVAAAYPIALMTILLRDAVGSAETAPFGVCARAYGFSRLALFHHVLLPPAAVPYLAAWINQLSAIFVAGVVLEVLFTIPGTGSLLLSSVQQRDLTMLQGLLILNSAFFIGLSWFSDMLLRSVDARQQVHV